MTNEEFDIDNIKEWAIFGLITSIIYSIIIFLVGSFIGLTLATLTDSFSTLPFIASLLAIATIGVFVVITIIEVVKWVFLGWLYKKGLYKQLKHQEVFTKWFLLNSVWMIGANILTGFSMWGILTSLVVSGLIIYLSLIIFKHIKYKSPFES